MPGTINGNPDFRPDADIAFRFDDAAFLLLTLDEQNAQVDASAGRISQYFSYQDPDDAGEPDAPTIWLPDLRDLAIQRSIAYNRNYGAPEPYFTIMVRFVDDPDQAGTPPGQIKAHADAVAQDILAEIVAIETEESLPITATLTWL